MPELTTQQSDQLEALIDSTSLYDVVQSLSKIATEKESHIWKDRATPIHWRNAAKRLDVCSSYFPDI